MESGRWNWARNLNYGAAQWHAPESIEELQGLVKRSARLKVIGSRHSFNEIADTVGDCVSLERLAGEMEIDTVRRTVTVGGAVTYGALGSRLHGEGFSIPNMASLPHICVAGACATATHGSGDRNGILAAAVSGIEIIDGRGARVALTRHADGETFCGAVVGLGALGIVIRLTLDISRTFHVRQDVYEALPFAQIEEAFETISANAYSVSLFTDWQNAAGNQVWCKRRIDPEYPFDTPAEWLGARLALADHHPIDSLSAESCTPQRREGPWHERLPHFRMEFTPSAGEELQSEYIVPRRHAVAAFQAVRSLSSRIGPLLQISEVRTIAADDFWMSPCYRQPCVAIHFTWVKDWTAVQRVLPEIEGALEPYEARPHWGKLFTMAPERLQSLYPKLPEFCRLLTEFDPEGKFRNAFLDRYVYG